MSSRRACSPEAEWDSGMPCQRRRIRDEGKGVRALDWGPALFAEGGVASQILRLVEERRLATIGRKGGGESGEGSAGT